MGLVDIAQVNPTDAWAQLAEDKSAVLIDVRTRAEWGFVGVPDLSSLGHSTIFVEWATWPEMSQNPDFVPAILAEQDLNEVGTMYFICRSGVRSQHAAVAMAQHCGALGRDVKCVNVAEGFEGDLDDKGRRGCLNGWKYRGLAWRQS